MLFYILLVILHVSSTQRHHCDAGEKIYVVQRIFTKSKDVIVAGCRTFQRKQCSNGCTWVKSCRLTPSWFQYKEGSRSYVAGIRKGSRGLQVYCCITLASILDDCRFNKPTSGRHLLKLSMVKRKHLRTFGQHFKNKTSADLIIRDVITKGMGKNVQVAAEVCSIQRERRECDIRNARKDKKRVLRLLLMNNRKRVSQEKWRIQSERLKQLKEEIFSDREDTEIPVDLEEPDDTEPVPDNPFDWDPTTEWEEVPEESFESSTTAPDEEESEESCEERNVSEEMNSECPNSEFSPCSSDEDLNRKLMKCCESLSSGCKPLCKYETTAQETISALLTNKCDPAGARAVFECASGGHDVTNCCKAKGVLALGDLCQPLCNPSDKKEDYINRKYMPCIAHTETIRQCFKAYIKIDGSERGNKCKKQRGKRRKNDRKENRKRKSKKTCPNADFSPCITEEKAEERFQSCCKSLVKECTTICQYRLKLQPIFLVMNIARCPRSSIRNVMNCASDMRDVTECCKAKGVVGGLCLSLCNPSGNKIDYGNRKLRNCAPMARNITSCFISYLSD